MKKSVKISLLVFLILAAAGGFFAWKNWHDRYVWPAPVSWMQDLPPEDRSHWPKEPTQWKQERVVLEAVTPAGPKTVAVTHYINSIGMKFIRVEPGTFLMGVTEEQMRRLHFIHLTGHLVTLTKPYMLGVFEVSNREYEQFDPGHAKKRAPIENRSESLDHPVEGVTWREANEFCRWLSAREGRQCRLPTEAEWEYACKAGTQTRTYWGDAVWDCNMANVGGLKNNIETWAEDNWTYSSPVGVFPPSPWGFYDMIGNAREWVSDWYAPFTTNAVIDPVGPPNMGHYRVIKGIGWSHRTRHVISGARDGNNPADLPDVIGFRVVCEVPAE